MHWPRHRSIHRTRNKALGVSELTAIALGGMVGGGIFTVLGLSVAMIGVYTPIAIAFGGGGVAALAAYSYVKLGVYYQDEGATYSFFKRTYPKSPFAASLIGWWVLFGYISTMALYAYTFASYALSGFALGETVWARKLVAGTIIGVFTLINVWSVKGMGRLEDWMVYSKLLVLAVISFVLINNANTSLPVLMEAQAPVGLGAVLIIAAVTFVAYEGFQLVINAMREMEEPARNIPRAIYTAIGLAVTIYVVIALGAMLAIPFPDIIEHQEYPLAAGAGQLLGHWGSDLVIIGALLATSSAISGTVFGASRQMAVIADDGYLPATLAMRRGSIPMPAICTMSALAFALILVGNLQVILEFGSVTFLLVSLLMAWANHCIRERTGASAWLTIAAIVTLAASTFCILYYEAVEQPAQLAFIATLYLLLAAAAWLYAKRRTAGRASNPQ